MADKPTPEQVEKAHQDAISAKDQELATVRKELADAKAEFAVQIAKLAPKQEQPAYPVEFQKKLDDEKAARVELQKRLDAETEKREEREAIEKAATFPGLPIETAKLAKSLRLIRKALPEADALVVEQALQAVSNQTKENAKLLQEIGRSGVNVDANGPEAQLEAQVAKHSLEKGVSRAAAYAEVTKSGQGAVLLQQIRKNEREADKAKG